MSFGGTFLFKIASGKTTGTAGNARPQILLSDIQINQNLSVLDIDHSLTPLEIKCDGSTYCSPIYDFPLVFSSNIWHNLPPLRYASLQSLSDLDFDISVSLKVKSDAAMPHI